MSRFLRLALIAATATTSLAAPVFAQTAAEQQRYRVAQQRYDRETQIFRQEQDRYQSAQQRGYGRGNSNGGYNNSGYRSPGYNQGYSNSSNGYTSSQGNYDERNENGYDPRRDYRDGNYQERTLSSDERVYAGNDGRYYCKRSDGTTGLVIGGAAGGLLGNVIDGGHSRIVGTLLGGAAGALAGKAVDQSNSQARCR